MRLECGLDGQVGPKRRQVALGMHIVALKCSPRGAKLRLDDGLEAKKGVLEGQLEKLSVGSLPTERDRWSAGGAGEGKEGASPSQQGIKDTTNLTRQVPCRGTANLMATPAFHRPLIAAVRLAPLRGGDLQDLCDPHLFRSRPPRRRSRSAAPPQPQGSSPAAAY